MLKLNLGCHDRPKAGYVNIDKDKYPGVDIIGDVSKLEMEDGCAEEIYASNILEHFSHTRTKEVLKEWYRLLSPDGILKISVPDFRRTVEIYVKCGLCPWVDNFLWGDQGYNGANHYCGFDEDKLRRLLLDVGFKEVSRVEKLPGSDGNECSNIVSNIDRKLVCLNMVAIK